LNAKAEGTSCGGGLLRGDIAVSRGVGLRRPLTIVRLLRTVLSFVGLFADREFFWSFDGREDFAIGIRR
jgi:hypothetical protein